MKRTKTTKLVLSRETLATVAGGTALPTGGTSRLGGGCDLRSRILDNCQQQSRLPAICETRDTLRSRLVCPTQQK